MVGGKFETRLGKLPLTENGVVRIMSNPNYSAKMQFTPTDLIGRLQKFVAQSNHEFWQDKISLRDEKVFTAEKIHSSRQLTNLYLLALAVENRGRLVTFDRGIPISCVRDAKAANLCAV